MKFGVVCFNWEPFAYNVRIYEETAERAESLAYDSFFVSDHFLRPFLPMDAATVKRHATHEAWSLLSYVAAKTSAIRLGTCVTPLPLRNPLTLAKVVATLDNLSGGRVTLGVGAGDDENELRVFGGAHSPGERVKRSREVVEAVRKLWTSDLTDYEGEYYRLERAILQPKPVQQPHPPIWSGAMREKMLMMTSELCDGWIPARSLGATVEFYERNGRQLQNRARELGRRPTMAVMGYVLAEGTSFSIPNFGSIQKFSNVVESYRQVGCEYMVLAFLPTESTGDLMEKVAREVIPSFR